MRSTMHEQYQLKGYTIISQHLLLVVIGTQLFHSVLAFHLISVDMEAHQFLLHAEP